MDFIFWFDTLNLGFSIIYNLKNIIFLSQKIDFVLANSWDPDEMPQ